MTVKKLEEVKEYKIQRPERAKLTAEESLKRMQEFVALRKGNFVAAIRSHQPPNVCIHV